MALMAKLFPSVIAFAHRLCDVVGDERILGFSEAGKACRVKERLLMSNFTS
jgi:hypothetical protein